MRSFTEPPGLRYSTLPSTDAATSGSPSAPRVTLQRRTSGVLPTRSTTESYTRTRSLYGAATVREDRPDGRAAEPGVPVTQAVVLLAPGVWRVPTFAMDL